MPKRRAGHAPPGSGVAVGTEYHWYILAHQNVRKLDANTYTTALSGLKYKLAHKRVGKETWSASDQAQRRHLIKILQEMIDDLSAEMPVEKAPARVLAAAKAERAPKTKLTQRRPSAARANARQGAPTRRRLVASGGRSRR